LRLSKRTGQIIAIGIVVIAFASLGTVLYDRLGEQSQLNEQLALTQSNLNRVQLKTLTSQQVELEKQLGETTSQFEAIKTIISQPLGSIAVTATLFDIAEAHNVEVIQMSSPSPTDSALEGVTYSVISLTAEVEGDVLNLVSFVKALNSFFTTGVINSVMITIPQTNNREKSLADIELFVYTYRGD